MSMPPAIVGDYPTEHSDEVLYRSALMPVVALVLVGPQLGMGRAALDFADRKRPGKSIAYTNYTSQKESTAFQLQIAEAARLIDSAHLHAYRAAADIDDAAARCEFPTT